MDQNIGQEENDIFYLGIKALIRNDEGKILLLHDTRRNLVDGTSRTYWDLPGGRVHREGQIEETLRREIKEEMGLDQIEIQELFDATNSHFRTKFGETSIGLILIVYKCAISKEAEITLSEEHDDFSWFTPKEAAKLLNIKYSEEFTSKIARID